MKKTMKQLFSSLLCICFLVVFSFSVGAAEALSKVIASLDTSPKYDIIEYDYVTGTKRVIPWESIPDYSSSTSTTYELDAMASELPRLAQMIAACQNTSASPFTVVDPDEPYIFTPPKTGNVYNVPYSGVVYLMLGITLNNGSPYPNWSRATGFMVAPDVMVTAGHAFVDEEYEITQVRVYPYHHSSMQPSVYYGDYIYPERWVCADFADAMESGADDLLDHDWCVVKLQEPLPDAFYFTCTYELLSYTTHPVFISGYPTCTDPACTNNPCYNQDFYQVTSEGYATQVSPNLIRYTNNTYAGNSGSPVYFPSYVCVGIHTMGGIPYNTGTKITEDIYNVISYYINLE